MTDMKAGLKLKPLAGAVTKQTYMPAMPTVTGPTSTRDRYSPELSSIVLKKNLINPSYIGVKFWGGGHFEPTLRFVLPIGPDQLREMDPYWRSYIWEIIWYMYHGTLSLFLLVFLAEKARGVKSFSDTLLRLTKQANKKVRILFRQHLMTYQ